MVVHEREVTHAAPPGLGRHARAWVRSTRDERPHHRRLEETSTAPLVVRTVALELPAEASLLDMLPEDHPVTWLRRGDGLVGCGVAAELRTTRREPVRGRRRLVARDSPPGPIVRSDVDEPGSGLVAFGTFAFADEPGESALIVPEVILGRRGDTAWLTTVSSVGGLDQLDRRLELATTPPAPVDVSFTDGALNGEQWMGVVAEAVRRINAGDLEKVVLARDLVATAGRADRRALAAAQAGRATTRPAGPSTSTASSAPRRSCWCAASAAWSPPGCWPAPSGAPATTPATWPRGPAGPVVEGPRGARVRRPLGRRGARAALLVDERARGAVRPAPAQRHAPGHRRRRRRPRRRHRHLARAGRGAAPLGRGRRHAHLGGRPS